MYEIEYITNNGKVREHNEDSLLINKKIISNISMDKVEKETIDKKHSIFAVADGMGGHKKGEVASKFVLTKLLKYLENIDSLDSLLLYLKKIKEDLDLFAENNISYKDMGTVLAGILFLENSYIVFNVGDCRVYENSFGFANLLTNDHSIVFSLYKNKKIEFNEINSHPKKNVVTSAFVANKAQKLNEIYAKEYQFKNKEFIICSDGMWENLNDNDIDECLSSDNKVDCLFKKVMNSEANDNVSIIKVKVNNEWS